MISQVTKGSPRLPVPGQVRARQKEETRLALLAAARSVLRRSGLAGLTARAVAQEAEVAVGTVFLHFSTTTHLVEILLDEHLAAALSRAFAGLPDHGLVARLMHVCIELFAAYGQEPDLARAYLQASLFDATSTISQHRLAAFREWFSAELSQARLREPVAKLADDAAFFAFFALYFASLVAGLRGEMEPALQRRVLTQTLNQLLFTQAKDQS